MARHLYREKDVLNFVAANQGLTAGQISTRLGRSVHATLRRLLSKGKLKRVKGVDSTTMQKAYKYFTKGAKR